MFRPSYMHTPCVCAFLDPTNNEEDGSLRLVDGVGPHDGRVEIFRFGQWGTVNFASWDLFDAIVVCRQLGYPTAVATKAYRCGNTTNWLSSVQCTGLESNLTQCRSSHQFLYSCTLYYGSAGVICAGE